MSSSCSSATVVDEGNAKMAVRGWVGWEEEIVMEDNDGEECKVCYFLCSVPPQDGGKSKRDLAVVGKYWGPGNIAYSADLEFLQSLKTALESGSGPARVVTLAMETTQLRWKSRKEVMDWLTSLVSGTTCSFFHALVVNFLVVFVPYMIKLTDQAARIFTMHL